MNINNSMIEDIRNDINGKSLTYRRDPTIRKSGTKIALTAEHVQEFVRCASDIVYFAEHYIYIQSSEGLSLIKLYDYQKQALYNLQNNRFNIFMWARQTSKSTTSGIFLIWYIIFHRDKQVALLANKMFTAREIFSRCLLMFEHLPHFLKPGVNYYNKSTLDLDNGSKLICAATSKSSIRGLTCNVLFCDEIAFLPPKIWTEFYTATYPVITIDNNSKIIICSTPNGYNHFQKLWIDAIEKRNLYVPFKVLWHQVPGRNENWKEETIRNTSEQEFLQEQECEFLAAESSLISATCMQGIEIMSPIKTLYNTTLKIYKEPIPDHVYISVVDASEGTARDYSTISIIDITETPMEQVATYRDNTIEPTLFPRIINELSLKYNEALLIVESNSVGSMILHDLMNNIEYNNIYSDDNIHPGIRTTKKTKSVGCSRFKEIIENKGLKINDYDTFKEMSNFVFYAGGFKAKPGNHDDLIMGLIIFAYFTTTDYFKELKEDYSFMDKILKSKNDMITEQDMEIGFVHVDGDQVSDADNDGFMF